MKLSDAKVRVFSSYTTANKDEDGYWKVISELLEKISFDGENFQEKKLEVMGISKDFSEAYHTAMLSIVREHQSLTNGGSTLFTELLANDTANDKEVTQT